MADTATLESLAELLPEEHRERFFKIASKFSSVPEDDDHLQMLEAVGFMMLVIDEVPARIAAILKDSRQRLGEEGNAQLRSEIVATLTASLDTPSYKDLRDTVASIRDQEIQFRRQVDGLHKSLGEAGRAMRPSDRVFTGLWTGFVGGCIVACGMAALVLTLPEFEGIWRQKPKSRAGVAWKALHDQGMLDYFETTLPEYKEPIGVFLLGGDVKEAFLQEGRGVIAVGIGGHEQ